MTTSGPRSHAKLPQWTGDRTGLVKMLQKVSKRKVRVMKAYEKGLMQLLENAPVYNLADASKIKGQGVYALI